MQTLPKTCMIMKLKLVTQSFHKTLKTSNLLWRNSSAFDTKRDTWSGIQSAQYRPFLSGRMRYHQTEKEKKKINVTLNFENSKQMNELSDALEGCFPSKKRFFTSLHVILWGNIFIFQIKVQFRTRISRVVN